jgi:effector-binding domain-containing protein
MAADPRLEHRQPTPYLAIAGAGSGERALRAFGDTSFPALFGRLRAHGAVPAAAPFFRFFRFVPDGDFEAEVGVPITTPIELANDRTVRLGELPAGRYIVYVHEGAYSADDDQWAGRDLRAAYRLLDAWVHERGLAWATGADGTLTVSIEQYLVGPGDTDDPKNWRTEIARLVAS